MIWTKASRFMPPPNLPIYVMFRDEDLHIEIFTDEDLKSILNSTTYEQWERDKNLNPEFNPDQNIEMRILEFWSFIPVLPPDEIIPALANLNDQIQRMQIQIKELREELTHIPRICSIQRMIENLQCQVAQINPDSYHKWKVDKLEKKFESAPIPLGRKL